MALTGTKEKHCERVSHALFKTILNGASFFFEHKLTDTWLHLSDLFNRMRLAVQTIEPACLIRCLPGFDPQRVIFFSVLLH